MPLSCVNYNNGHMIKFQLFDTSNSYQCHFAEISTFVVSIAHYMRAYFNYLALTQGQDFEVPDDAAYLSCNKIKINEDNEDDQYGNVNAQYLYAKIGCMERSTFTSTKLQLHLYVDQQCSQPYDDGGTKRDHSKRGYVVGNQQISSTVSFKVPFYHCHTCAPEQVSGTFNKRYNNWYDDDYISIYGEKRQQDGNDDQNNENQMDDAANVDDDTYYMASNDDVNYDDAKFNDDYNRRSLISMEDYLQHSTESAVVSYRNKQYRLGHGMEEESNGNIFQSYVPALFSSSKKDRELYDNYYDIGDWNMCERIYKYGVWCDAECRSLDFFRTDQWSSSDIFLLSIMCTFLSGMMLLIVAKRLKAQQKARMYGDDQPLPGLPPFGMALVFFVTMLVIIVLAKLKFVNETLVFAVVTCILLFVYMLKLTLFENRRPVLLAAPRHDMFDNPLDDHLFD